MFWELATVNVVADPVIVQIEEAVIAELNIPIKNLFWKFITFTVP